MQGGRKGNNLCNQLSSNTALLCPQVTNGAWPALNPFPLSLRLQLTKRTFVVFCVAGRRCGESLPSNCSTVEWLNSATHSLLQSQKVQ